MGVQLNIKDPETVRLARELAGQTGRSVTETIRQALERASMEREAEIARKVAEVTRIVDEFRSRLSPEELKLTSKELMEAIYDDGLPA